MTLTGVMHMAALRNLLTVLKHGQPRSASCNPTARDFNGPGLLGRVPFIRLQLEEAGANIIGLQETRAKQTETVESATHFRFLSKGDDRGNLGVEIWFAKTIPFAWQQDRPLFFQANDFRVISWSPRHRLSCLAISTLACSSPGNKGLESFAGNRDRTRRNPFLLA